ncbi:uncharacterized protein MEPE_02846 [Melanopsichium pennsylvanicum]|uniref:Uncharacterized protein n=1 Tax=Melanopsichium pennsylvanicum TaxID=63383 RepID=A0AAJ4XL57_9BASI|nr:uncharacterized protein MEPE_02846 [Melanopsichium pennsylvanicum]
MIRGDQVSPVFCPISMWNRTPASSGGNSIISTPQSNTCSSSSSTFTHSSKDSTPHTRAKTDLGDDTRSVEKLLSALNSPITPTRINGGATSQVVINLTDTSQCSCGFCPPLHTAGTSAGVAAVQRSGTVPPLTASLSLFGTTRYPTPALVVDRSSDNNNKVEGGSRRRDLSFVPKQEQDAEMDGSCFSASGDEGGTLSTTAANANFKQGGGDCTAASCNFDASQQLGNSMPPPANINLQPFQISSARPNTPASTHIPITAS